MQISANRKYLNEVMIPKFASSLNPGSVVLDVGKSQTWDYSSYFLDAQKEYFTVDYNPKAGADFSFNVEEPLPEFYFRFNGVICHGVTEQCLSPYHLIKGVSQLLKKDGLLLLGAVSLGYPIYSTDYQRLTDGGARRILLLNNFQILESHMVGDEKNPEYLFYICKKV